MIDYQPWIGFKRITKPCIVCSRPYVCVTNIPEMTAPGTCGRCLRVRRGRR